jgi:hypothetical protein
MRKELIASESGEQANRSWVKSPGAIRSSIIASPSAAGTGQGCDPAIMRVAPAQ